MRVAVIGAGYAGLAAAVELAGAGAIVDVFEAGHVLGGRAREVRRGGRLYDNGQHVLVGACEQTLRSIGRVGVDARQALMRLPLSLHTPGRARLRAARLPAPLHLIAALATAGGLTLRERFAAARFVAALRRGSPGPDESVAALLARCGQHGGPAQRLWEPLCRAALNTPPAAASARVFVTLLRDTLCAARAASDLLLPRGSLTGLFPAPAARFVERHGGSVRTGVRIAGIAAQSGRFSLAGDRAYGRYAVVIAAVAPHALARLLAPLPAAAPVLDQVGRLRYQPIATCYLEYGPGVRLPEPMMGDESGAVDWFFDRGALQATPGRIAAVISADPVRIGSAGRDIAARAHRALERMLGPLAPPSSSFTIVERRATFSCVPGLARPEMQTGVAGLLLAGDYVASPYPGTIEAAVRSGVAAAHAARAYLRT